MKLIVELDGETLEVSISREDGVVKASVEGRDYDLSVSEPEPNVYLIKSGNRVVEFTVLEDGMGGYSVTTGRSGFKAVVADPRKLGGAAAAGALAEGVAEIRTQMPGKVVRVLVEAGESVSAGDGIIVVEAMKMQNEMKSPKDGTVLEIRSAEGATVNAGDVLVVIE